jgi:RimJ/RimL family protein N-acetyltransferase
VGVADWRRLLVDLLADPARIADIARRSATLTDGKGCERVVSNLLAQIADKALELRAATAADARLIFDWANDPQIRAASFSTAAIEWEGHNRWLKANLADPRCRIYIGSQGGEPVGQVRFKLDDDGGAVIGVNTRPGLQGLGLGAKLIGMGIRRLQESSSVLRIHAYIRPENGRSIGVFGKAGFVTRGRATVDGHDCVHLVKELR